MTEEKTPITEEYITELEAMIKRYQDRDAETISQLDEACRILEEAISIYKEAIALAKTEPV